jgi:lipid-binding SYLF domain-containing protein
MSKLKNVFGVLIFLILAFSTGSSAQNKEIRDAAKTADKATKALNEVMAIPADAIPETLIRNAKAVAVFPDVLKAAFLVGGSGGKGIITRRVGNGWSAPAMFKMGGGSFGAQIGASSTDYVMLFMTEDSLASLLQDKFEIGGEASVAAGPVGRTAKASTDAQLNAAILSYSRSKGLFAGVSLSGAVISPDNDANRALYSLTAKDILTGADKVPVTSIPAATKGFQEAVSRHGP